MIEVTIGHTECTHFNLDYSQMFAVALHWYDCRFFDSFELVLRFALLFS